MKTIPLRTLPDPRGELPDVDSKEIILQAIRTPLDKQRGADITEIRKGIRILDALDAANGSIELEDADYEHLCEKTIATTWGLIDKRLLTVIDDILNA